MSVSLRLLRDSDIDLIKKNHVPLFGFNLVSEDSLEDALRSSRYLSLAAVMQYRGGRSLAVDSFLHYKATNSDANPENNVANSATTCDSSPPQVTRDMHESLDPSGDVVTAGFAVTCVGTLNEFWSSSEQPSGPMENCDHGRSLEGGDASSINDSSSQKFGSGLNSLEPLGFHGSELAVNLCLLGVLPAYRRQGIASVMLKQVMSSARKTRARMIFLHVQISNSAARKLYTRAGFRVAAHVPSFYPVPSTAAGNDMLYESSPGALSGIKSEMQDANLSIRSVHGAQEQIKDSSSFIQRTGNGRGAENSNAGSQDAFLMYLSLEPLSQQQQEAAAAAAAQAARSAASALAGGLFGFGRLSTFLMPVNHQQGVLLSHREDSSFLDSNTVGLNVSTALLCQEVLLGLLTFKATTNIQFMYICYFGLFLAKILEPVATIPSALGSLCMQLLYTLRLAAASTSAVLIDPPAMRIREVLQENYVEQQVQHGDSNLTSSADVEIWPISQHFYTMYQVLSSHRGQVLTLAGGTMNNRHSLLGRHHCCVPRWDAALRGKCRRAGVALKKTLLSHHLTCTSASFLPLTRFVSSTSYKQHRQICRRSCLQ